MSTLRDSPVRVALNLGIDLAEDPWLGADAGRLPELGVRLHPRRQRAPRSDGRAAPRGPSMHPTTAGTSTASIWPATSG